MFYFTCNESKKNELFHDILIYWDAPVYNVYNVQISKFSCYMISVV